jgi:O-acetyl-ADP-ribose deacetylase (regulator of RNase III)
MLSYLRTSILTSSAQTVVNTVNTVGVMGKGLASAMKTRYPDMFKAYVVLCQERQLDIGRLWLWKAPDKWILNFPTKKHWRNPSKLSYIEAGLKKFVAEYERRGIYEISFPRLGCGNGGLDWADVQPLMERHLALLPIQIYIHDFEKDIGAPEHKDRRQDSKLKFERSFPKFVNDLRSVILKNRGDFFTVTRNTHYKARMEDSGDLKIERQQNRTSTIPAEELYETWTLLLRGPLTKRRLAGHSRKEAPYLFPILAALPYARIIELQPRGEPISMLAVELLDDEIGSQTVDPEKELVQGELTWR